MKSELFGMSTRNAKLSDTQLTEILARCVMGWKIGPDRFVLEDCRWLPRWRFQPTKNIADAFRLLEASCVQEYFLRVDRNGFCRAQVRTSGTLGDATAGSMALAICHAVAQVHGVHVAGHEQRRETRNSELLGGF